MSHRKNWNKYQWERIEEEYQEPAREVVRVMHHEMRVPLRVVSGALYVSEATLRQWCKIWGLETRRKGYVKKEVPGKVQLRARLMGYQSVAQAIASMRANGLRWEDICLKLKCAEGTISRYIPASAKGYYNLSETGLKVKQATARQLNERMATGEIERGGFAKVPLREVQPGEFDTASKL